MDKQKPEQPRRMPAGLIPALVCALLLIAAFVVSTTSTPMPSSERWAALPTFALLVLAYTLQGSPDLYDGLGRIVRRDWRALLSLLLLVPVLYASYSVLVDAFAWGDVLSALAFVGVPALALAQGARQRIPTLFDLVAALYFLLSLTFALLPELQLPPRGVTFGFFTVSFAPVLLLLLAARGWPGLGFTWFLTWYDMRTALLMTGLLLWVMAPLALLTGMNEPTMSLPVFIAPVLDEVVLAVTIYFLVALPQEIFFRGFIQNGIERYAEAKLWRPPPTTNDTTKQKRRPRARLLPRLLSLLLTALIFAATYFVNPLSQPQHVLLAFLAGLGYGWIYQQTGKVTASAVGHLLVSWCWTVFFI